MCTYLLFLLCDFCLWWDNLSKNLDDKKSHNAGCCVADGLCFEAPLCQGPGQDAVKAPTLGVRYRGKVQMDCKCRPVEKNVVRMYRLGVYR